jgi:GMP synthase-like glutamine amidotransferase
MSAGDSLRALVLQHEEPTPGGYVNEWLSQRGADQDVYRIDIEQRDPDPREYGLIVSLGSEFPAFDDSIAWLARERKLLSAATEADVPVLGICFGGQLLARTLGGRSFRGEAEVGWMPVRTRNSALVPEGPWFQWHFDTFTVPPGAELIADSPAGPQAYTIGRSLGVQFHPEVTIPIVEEWISLGGDDLARNRVDGDDLLAETRSREEENRARAWQLLDAFVDRVGLA